MTELVLFSVLSAKCPIPAQVYHVLPLPFISVKCLQDLYFHSHYIDKESEVEELNASSRDELVSIWLQYQWSFLHNLSQPQGNLSYHCRHKGVYRSTCAPTSQLATYVSSHGVTPQVLCDWHRSMQGSFLNDKVSLCSMSNTWEKQRGVIPSICAEENRGKHPLYERGECHRAVEERGKPRRYPGGKWRGTEMGRHHSGAEYISYAQGPATGCVGPPTKKSRRLCLSWHGLDMVCPH